MLSAFAVTRKNGHTAEDIAGYGCRLKSINRVYELANFLPIMRTSPCGLPCIKLDNIWFSIAWGHISWLTLWKQIGHSLVCFLWKPLRDFKFLAEHSPSTAVASHPLISPSLQIRTARGRVHVPTSFSLPTSLLYLAVATGAATYQYVRPNGFNRIRIFCEDKLLKLPWIVVHQEVSSSHYLTFLWNF